MLLSNKKNNTGFTLLETLVAISILTVAIGAAFSMAQKSFNSTYTAKNQATAYFLAAEGLELVRTVRDNVALYNKNNPNNTISWLKPLESKCLATPSAFGCDINALSYSLYINPATKDIANPNAIRTCGEGGCRLKIYTPESGKAVYDSSDNSTLPNSFFSRVISINRKEVGEGKSEAVVTSQVTWQGKDGVSLTETINNWNDQ